MATSFQHLRDGLANAETTVEYTAPTGILPPGFGIGPSGSMKIEILPTLGCPGHQGGTIQLTYKIPAAQQLSYHPNPGVPYDGIHRRSYIPNTPEGRCLLTRYKYAFQHGYMFLVGHSVAKAKDNQVTWSTLPNHTSLKGGAFGFPDPEYLNKANLALDNLGIPSADAIVDPHERTMSATAFAECEIEVSPGNVTPIPLPKTQQDAVPCAADAVPLAPPYFVPATPNLTTLTVPNWTLSSKESKKCTLISQDDNEAKQLRMLHIPIVASEIVVCVYVKDLTSANLQDLANLTATRATRSALLTRGSVQLKKLPMMKAGLLAVVADRGKPNIKFGILDLRALHMHHDVIVLAFRQDETADSGEQQEATKYALYQTPEPSRFLTSLATVAVAAYVGVPNWAVPITWSGSLPALQSISKREYTNWMGVDGGFSSSVYAAALAYHVQHKLEIGRRLMLSDGGISSLVMEQQPKRIVPTTGPQLLNLVELAKKLAAPDKLFHRLVEHGLDALSFNLVFRRLKLSKYRIPADVSAFRNALLKALLYNVTLREVDFSGTNLRGFGEDIGKSWAMNGQPLIARVDFSDCHLTGRDLRGLLPGIARIWCGGTSFAESIKMAGNNTIPTATWDVFFRTFVDPCTLPFWPQKPPPPPSLAFLQELDVRKTKAIGPGLVRLSQKLTDLRLLKLSCSASREASEVLNSLVAAKAPLEMFVGEDVNSSCAGALFEFSRTLRMLTFDGFRGDATPLVCGWPDAVPKVTVNFHGKLYDASFSAPTGSGYAPGSLQIENNANFGAKAVDHALFAQATGLKTLVLTKMHYSQLSRAVPVLSFCGLESLRVQGGQKRTFGGEEIFWSVFASSTTLREIHLPSQLQGPNEVTKIGQFLRSNRSVQQISFDGSFLLDVESVKALRGAFYGNKKVTFIQYPETAKKRTMEKIRKDTGVQLHEVSSAKSNIKRIFRSHYSKYNRNWRDKPNQLKLPYVEKIRVAKRKIGKMQRDSIKIGQLLGDIKACVDRNRNQRMTIEEEKRSVKLARKEGQLKHLAMKKNKFLHNLVTKLQKAKRRGRQKKSAKTQVPRLVYYSNRHMWPSSVPAHRRIHSSYRCYNDPYYARYHHQYGYYYHSCDAERNRYLDNEDGAVADFPFESEPDDGSGIADDSQVAGQVAVLAETVAVWDNLLCDVANVNAGLADPWGPIDTLIHFAQSNLDAVLSSEFLSEVHSEASELGADVASDICRTLDDGAAVNDKINEISESLDVAPEMVGTLVDSYLDGNFDFSALVSSLGDMPDYDGGVDIVGIDDATDAVAMYAGAGPRDLDDGGPSFGGCGSAALAGARRRARARKENRILKCARENASNRLLSGYKSLALHEGFGNGTHSIDDTWPDDPMENWIEEAQAQQIESMSQSNLFQLPEVSEIETPSLLVEWDEQGDHEIDASSGIEVVLVTQCSLDRLPNLEAQLLRWKGKASVVIYLKPKECHNGTKQMILSCIENAKGRAEQPQERGGSFDISVSIVKGYVDGEPYPINYLRNIALLEARRQHLRFHDSLDKSAVLLVDVDFRPSANLHETLHAPSAALAILKSRWVVVCPAFECNKVECPESLEELKACVEAGGAEGFHLSHFPQGHGPTQFEMFWARSLRCKDGTVEDSWKGCYAVRYEKLFEPYIVMASNDVPLYDERFQGYGLNKVSHLANIARQKANRFIALPGVFLIAPAHERSKSWADRYGSHTEETKFSQLWLKGLYHNFMKALAEDRGAIVSDQTRAKHCLQCLQQNKSNRKDGAFQFNQLQPGRDLVSSLSTNHPQTLNRYQ